MRDVLNTERALAMNKERYQRAYVAFQLAVRALRQCWNNLNDLELLLTEELSAPGHASEIFIDDISAAAGDGLDGDSTVVSESVFNKFLAGLGISV